MRKVIFVVTPLHKTQFSGGSIAVFKYAEGLQRLGWDVSILPLGSSPLKGWFNRFDSLKITTKGIRELLKDFLQSLSPLFAQVIKFIFLRSSQNKKIIKSNINSSFVILLNIFHKFLPYESKRSTWISNLKQHIDTQAILIATSYETAYALQLTGIKDYIWFMMHDERLFVKDFKNYKSVAELDVEITLNRSNWLITNSSWLKERMLNEFADKYIWLCVNALEDAFKVGYQRRRKNLKTLTILSYSGRGADWKGFAEMHEGVKLAISKRPDIIFNWRVYGPIPILEGQNVNKFCTNLGFISDSDLINEYLNADVLLSASWYESFPLFPLEGMGLGAAVIATMPGCEDFLRHEQNGLVVQTQNPTDICSALIRLADDEDLRLFLINNGFKTAKDFNWNSSCANLNKILLEYNVEISKY